MKTSFSTVFNDNVQADLFLKSQGFKKCSNRLSDFANDKNGKAELVRGQYSRGKETACIFWKKFGWEIVVYDSWFQIITPKVKGKPGPKSKAKKDKKERVVMFFKKSTIKDNGGVDSLRKAIYGTYEQE